MVDLSLKNRDFYFVLNKTINCLIYTKGLIDMDFGEALKELKNNKKVARKGWNGKGQFVYYVPANEYDSLTDVAKNSFGPVTRYNAYLAIKTVQGIVSTWVPSINDCLSEDWEVVE